MKYCTFIFVLFLLACTTETNKKTSHQTEKKRPSASFVECVGKKDSLLAVLDGEWKLFSARSPDAPQALRLSICQGQVRFIRNDTLLTTHPYEHTERFIYSSYTRKGTLEIYEPLPSWGQSPLDKEALYAPPKEPMLLFRENIRYNNQDIECKFYYIRVGKDKKKPYWHKHFHPDH